MKNIYNGDPADNRQDGLPTNYADTQRCRKTYNKYRMERNKQLNTRSLIIFLVRCRKSGIMPNYIYVNKIFETSKTTTSGTVRKTLETCIHNFHNKILNILIKQKHEMRIQNSNRVLEIINVIRGVLTPDEASQLFNSEGVIERKTKANITLRHLKKFTKLQEQQRIV